MKLDRYEELEEKYGSAAFQKFPLTVVSGRGASVFDPSGKEYTDFIAGYGVALVGHSNPAVAEAIERQAKRLITCHGSFYNDARSEFLEKLSKVAPLSLDKALLTNSGTESVEAAIKLARRHTGRKGIVSMKGGFHGKTYGALSATWNAKYREPFEPLLSGFDFVEFGDATALASIVGEETAAVIAEPIQGESGVVVPPPGYFREVREICDRWGALLIFDEIQTGLGRTGRMWAGDHWKVVPDIMTVSKGLGGGVPIGAAMATKEIMGSLKRGEHTSTFAGNPLACAAASATLDFIVESDLPAQARVKGKAFKDGLSRLSESNRLVREVRGMGLMLALETRVDIHRLLLAGISRGAIFGHSGRQTFRFLPPLVIQDGQISAGLRLLEDLLQEEEARRLRPA